MYFNCLHFEILCFLLKNDKYIKNVFRYSHLEVEGLNSWKAEGLKGYLGALSDILTDQDCHIGNSNSL